MVPLSTTPCPATASASHCSLGMNRLRSSSLAWQSLQCWRCSPVAPRRRRSRPQSSRAALLDPPPFDPSKLSIEYLPGGRDGKLTAGRRYTLTHNDVTGSLQLSIGREYNQRQLAGWYTRMLRDEILAEWQDTPLPVLRTKTTAGEGGSDAPLASSNGSGSDCEQPVPSLHVYCHVSGEEMWPAPPALRSFIFQREMALVLDTISHAEAAALAAAPHLRAAPVYVHLRSDVPELDRVVQWGVLGERATWRTARSSIMQSLLSSVMGTLDEADGDATDGSAGSWSRSAFSDAAAGGSWDGGDVSGSCSSTPVGEALPPPPPQQQQPSTQQQHHVQQQPVKQHGDLDAPADVPPPSSSSSSSMSAEQELAAVVAGATTLSGQPLVPGQPVVPVVAVSCPPNGTPPSSSPGTPASITTLGAANGAVSLAADPPSWLSASGAAGDGRPRAPIAAESAGRAVPVVASSRQR